MSKIRNEVIKYETMKKIDKQITSFGIKISSFWVAREGINRIKNLVSKYRNVTST